MAKRSESKLQDGRAAAELLPSVYEELRSLARHKLRGEKKGHSLQATALVHEVFLRMAGAIQGKGQSERWNDSHHFFAAAAEAMRRILVESARRKKRQKRGGDRQRDEREVDAIAAPQPNLDLVALDDALGKLMAVQPRKAELVKLRYFAGLTIKEAADVLQISGATAERDWNYAQAWLSREMSL